MDERVPIKMAYEFLALHVGSGICENLPSLRAVRAAPLGDALEARDMTVERLLAPRYTPIHGLAFESNDPCVTIQVRLFGKVSYRVRFHRARVASGHRAVYTLDLRTGDEHLKSLGDISSE